MEQWVFRGFILILTIQILVAIIVCFDAHRHDLKNPPIYLSVALTPIVGIIISIAYLYDRENFPKWPEGETVAQSENRTQMKTEIAYFVGLIILFTIIGIVRSLYFS